jgi:hypothetical protein
MSGLHGGAFVYPDMGPDINIRAGRFNRCGGPDWTGGHQARAGDPALFGYGGSGGGRYPLRRPVGLFPVLYIFIRI